MLLGLQFHEWTKFVTGLAKETKHTILELDGIKIS
jgi:hypothetical protein